MTLRSDPDRRQARIASVTSLAAVGAVLATMWWSRDDVAVAPVLALLAVGAVLGWSVQIDALSRIWQRVGFVVSTTLIVLLVAFTGASASNYQDMFLIVPLTTALTLPAGGFVASLVTAVAGAFMPALYESVPRSFLADTVADAAVWAAAATVVFVQVQRRRQQASQLQEANELKSAFLQATSHELRTPLTVILGIAQTFRHRERLGDDLYETLADRLLAQSERLRTLLTDLLDVDRLLRGTVHINRAPTDLARLIVDVIEHLEDPERITADLQPVVVPVDSAKIERVIDNLLANAVKHSRGADIWVRLEPDGDEVLLTIEDSGPGIPDGLHTEIFEPFRQGPASTADASPGTGIGLTLVHRFVNLHGGRVWAENRPEGGARFRVALPQES